MLKPINFEVLIGIDPDIERNGVALISGQTQAVSNMDFWALYDFLKSQKKSTLVYIEAGWLNRGNWHLNGRMSLSQAAETGRRTGLNHATGQMIENMCQYLDMPYKLIRPTQTKVNSIFFNKLTGWIGRTNQEQRDAFMLIHGLNFKT